MKKHYYALLFLIVSALAISYTVYNYNVVASNNSNFANTMISPTKHYYHCDGKITEVATSTKYSQSISYNDKVNLLTRAVYAEAEGEPFIGKVAVAAVLLNRVNHSQFPNSLSGVIYQNRALESVSNGRINAGSNLDSKKAAIAALNGWDPSYGCLYFWNPYKKVSKWIWTRKIVVKYGSHVFGK